jgi:hypothetical protein
MSCYDRGESHRILWRTVSPPGDMKVGTEQSIIPLVDLTCVRDIAHVKHLEWAAK